jgi:hypothetical protein
VGFLLGRCESNNGDCNLFQTSTVLRCLIITESIIANFDLSRCLCWSKLLFKRQRKRLRSQLLEMLFHRFIATFLHISRSLFLVVCLQFILELNRNATFVSTCFSRTIRFKFIRRSSAIQLGIDCGVETKVSASQAKFKQIFFSPTVLLSEYLRAVVILLPETLGRIMPSGLLVSNCNRILIFISAGGYAEGIACYFFQDYLSPSVAFSRRPAYLRVSESVIATQYSRDGPAKGRVTKYEIERRDASRVRYNNRYVNRTFSGPRVESKFHIHYKFAFCANDSSEWPCDLS